MSAWKQEKTTKKNITKKMSEGEKGKEIQQEEVVGGGEGEVPPQMNPAEMQMLAVVCFLSVMLCLFVLFLFCFVFVLF